jgi:hypothetical protein
MTRRTIIPVSLCLLLFHVAAAWAQMPEFKPRVTDVTAFKDGHALVLARATVKTKDGWCRTYDVPSSILGAFWTFVNDNASKVDQVQAGFLETAASRPCLTLREMIQANAGKKAAVMETSGALYEGVLLGIPESAGTRDEESAPPEPSEACARRVPDGRPTAGQFALIQTVAGVKLVKVEDIRSLTLLEKTPVTARMEKERKRTISIHVARKDKTPDPAAEIGMVYLQKGVRWIPDYRVELLAGGRARVTLQATVVNDLADLENVDLRLVVGVPGFIMQDVLSPMALREVNLRLSSYFAPLPNRADSSSMFSNAIMAQQIAAPCLRPGERRESSEPDVLAEGRREDLFVYHKPGFSLKKGHRAAIELLEVTVPYEDIYTWEIPALPDTENLNEGQVRMLATVSPESSSRVMHEIRLENNTRVPWTTGPAMVFKENVPLGQQILKYTSLRNKVDLPITVATDVNPRKEEAEVGAERGVQIGGNHYTQYRLHGKLFVTNFKDKPVKVYVTRNTFGTITQAANKGRITLTGPIEDQRMAQTARRWGWLPWWWFGVNSFSQVRWEAVIEPGKTATFEYDWYYYLHN